MNFDSRKKAVLERIKRCEEAVSRAKEYLESNEHAHWEKFKPFLVKKFRDGKELPPHKDWVKNVFLPNYERSLGRAEKLLERLNNDARQQS
ncbi:MAG: hypothetical protein ACKVQJ_05045 [Pyrinomonadaceae bacterium]